MLKRYNVAADLICLAHAFYKKGQVKDALKLMVRANEEEDIQDLVDVIDEENNSLDPMVEDEVEEVEAEEEVEEVEDVDDVIDDVADEAGCKEESEVEDEEVEAEDEDIEDLPSVEEVMSKVMAKKRTIANLKSLKRNKVSSRLSKFRR